MMIRKTIRPTVAPATDDKNATSVCRGLSVTTRNYIMHIYNDVPAFKRGILEGIVVAFEVVIRV